jgi:hypothetical protein
MNTTDRHKLAKVANDWASAFDKREMDIQDWFMLSMARMIPPLYPFPISSKPILNLGAGYRQIGKSVPLDLEHGWNAETDWLQDANKVVYHNGSIAGIWAHGFFEHISPARVPIILWECQRVLCYGGVLNIVVPHALSELYHEDITHKSQWTEATLKNLFDNPYYDTKERWQLHIHAQFIMGVAWRNLALFIQLVK